MQKAFKQFSYNRTRYGKNPLDFGIDIGENGRLVGFWISVKIYCTRPYSTCRCQLWWI